MTPRRAAKVDKNQPEIVRALRDAGATVQHTHMIGQGCPDIIVGFRGQNYFMEIKWAKGQLTADEADWFLMWNGQKNIVRCIDDAYEVIGLEVYP